ncbi:OmpA family protein [Vibrio sp. CAU 1672]|uniref:OmpA family protein n=1 Tax=Vibrio sp. CAU 1672 TaxID=3032594 RepID=UPI0023D97CD3|nr:OmpA family protein [Vibrio sp. CAU 1672]MDF2152765.1 OmpA family protein [Vibrio sp. CAU 1672]
MRHWFLLTCGVLSGCSTLSSSLMLSDMLDVAPKTNQELRHPEWGKVQTSTVPVQRYVAKPAAKSLPAQQDSSLEMYLNRHQIPYERLNGDHVMLRLKEQINFQTGSATLAPQSKDWIRSLSHYLAGRPDVDVVIDGHADSTGKNTFNDRLSEQRARAVEKQVLAADLPRERVFSRGFGEYVPRCSNKTQTGKACNRRVELMLIVEK